MGPGSTRQRASCSGGVLRGRALERAQGRIRLPNGRALTGFAQEYKLRGTTSLLAALEVATRLVQFRDCAKHEPADPSKAVNADFVMMILVC